MNRKKMSQRVTKEDEKLHDSNRAYSNFLQISPIDATMTKHLQIYSKLSVKHPLQTLSSRQPHPKQHQPTTQHQKQRYPTLFTHHYHRTGASISLHARSPAAPRKPDREPIRPRSHHHHSRRLTTLHTRYNYITHQNKRVQLYNAGRSKRRRVQRGRAPSELRGGTERLLGS